jgi:predicted nucleic acid-binding protein
MHAAVLDRNVLVAVLRDPADEFVLDLAIGGRCGFIVTYNKRDFIGADQFGIEVVRPGEFLKIIEEEQ